MHLQQIPVVLPSVSHYYLRMSRLFDSPSEAKYYAGILSKLPFAADLRRYGFIIIPQGRRVVMDLGNGSFWLKLGMLEGLAVLTLLQRFLSMRDTRDIYLQGQLALFEHGGQRIRQRNPFFNMTPLEVAWVLHRRQLGVNPGEPLILELDWNRDFYTTASRAEYIMEWNFHGKIPYICLQSYARWADKKAWIDEWMKMMVLWCNRGLSQLTGKQLY